MATTSPSPSGCSNDVVSVNWRAWRIAGVTFVSCRLARHAAAWSSIRTADASMNVNREQSTLTLPLKRARKSPTSGAVFQVELSPASSTTCEPLLGGSSPNREFSARVCQGGAMR
jgi:hypothetical protein